MVASLLQQRHLAGRRHASSVVTSTGLVRWRTYTVAAVVARRGFSLCLMHSANHQTTRSVKRICTRLARVPCVRSSFTLRRR